MRRIWLGMLLASLPLALLAQPQDQRSRKDILFPPSQPPAPADVDTTRVPPPSTITIAPAPRYDPSAATPRDDPVAAAPLPPPAAPSDTTQEMVPNPLDTPDDLPPPGASKQAQSQGQPQRGGWVQMGTATLQALDKVNARSTTIAVKVGDTGHFGSLDVAVRGCFVRTPDRPADATAFLVIRDHRADAPAFNGWMVRSAPYLSMMAHPIYDVRVAGCAP